MSTPTPRTDNVVRPFIGNEDHTNIAERSALLDLARELERELAAAKDRIEELEAEPVPQYASELRLAGEKIEHWKAVAGELAARLPPFVKRNSSDEHIFIAVSTADIKSAREAIANYTKLNS